MVFKLLCKQQYALDHHADMIITLSYYDAVQHWNGGRRVLKSQRAGKHDRVDWDWPTLGSATSSTVPAPPVPEARVSRNFSGSWDCNSQLAEGNLLAGVSLIFSFYPELALDLLPGYHLAFSFFLLILYSPLLCRSALLLLFPKLNRTQVNSHVYKTEGGWTCFCCFSSKLEEKGTLEVCEIQQWMGYSEFGLLALLYSVIVNAEYKECVENV